MLILVTGGTGLLGNNVVRQLLARGDQVRVLLRNARPSNALKDIPVDVAVGDVRNRPAVAEALQGVDGVIHSAGYVKIGWSDADTHRSINVEGTRNIAELARQLQIRMVHVSSVNALGIGGPDFEADEESARPEVVPCPYVTSKREAEQVVLGEVAKGLSCPIINPGLMFGPWDWMPSSGRMILEVAQRFTPLAPTGSITVGDARDVAAGALAALHKGETGRRYIMSGHNLSYFDLWKEIARVCRAQPPYFRAGPMQRWIGGWGGDTWYKLTGREPDLNSAGVAMSCQHHRFTSRRAMNELGFQVRPLEESIRDAWQWFLDHGYAKAGARA